MAADDPPASVIPYAKAGVDVRPAPVTTLAAIGVVLGVMGLLCKPASLAITLFLRLPQPDPMLTAVQNNPMLRAFTTVDALTGMLMCALLVLSSIGCVSLKDWARLGMLCYAVLALALTAVVQGVSHFVLAPELEQALRGAGAASQHPWAQSWWAQAVGLVLRTWFPILILVYFNRADVKQAFAHGLARKGI